MNKITRETELVSDNFVGPFNLLLELIQREKLNINEISLAQMTNSYLLKIKEINPYYLSAFLETLSTLILIKSKTLLQEEDCEEVEKSEIVDLKLKLEVYEKFTRMIDVILARLFNKDFFSRSSSLMIKKRSNYDKFDSAILEKTFLKLIKNTEKINNLKEKNIKDKLRLKKVLSLLEKRLVKDGFLSFKRIVKNATKEEKILVFLVILELNHRTRAMIKQQRNFCDIRVVKN